MRDLITILIVERKGLLRGFAITFFLCFPFTFLPTLIQNGWNLTTIAQRIPASFLYASGFALLVIISAVSQNYKHLIRRKELFDKPAFQNLNFYGRVDGLNSSIAEMETFLIGRVENYFFTIRIQNYDLKKIVVGIEPHIDLSENEDLQIELEEEYHFENQNSFRISVTFSAEELEKGEILWDELMKWDKIFMDLGIKAIEIDEEELA